MPGVQEKNDDFDLIRYLDIQRSAKVSRWRNRSLLSDPVWPSNDKKTEVTRVMLSCANMYSREYGMHNFSSRAIANTMSRNREKTETKRKKRSTSFSTRSESSLSLRTQGSWVRSPPMLGSIWMSIALTCCRAFLIRDAAQGPQDGITDTDNNALQVTCYCNFVTVFVTFIYNALPFRNVTDNSSFFTFF